MPKVQPIQTRIQKFTNTKKGNKVLQHLSVEKKLGWEKWLQYELAFALTDLGVPSVEFKFAYDKRMKVSTGKSKFENGYVDILFRKKSTAKDYFTAVELKLGRSPTVVRAMLSDLIKIGASKSKLWKYRSVMAVGIYRDTGVSTNKFSRGLQELIDGKFINLLPIKNTDFKMLFLGWSVPPRMALKENYQEWLKKVEKVLKKNDVGVKKKKVPSRV